MYHGYVCVVSHAMATSSEKPWSNEHPMCALDEVEMLDFSDWSKKVQNSLGPVWTPKTPLGRKYRHIVNTPFMLGRHLHR